MLTTTQSHRPTLLDVPISFFEYDPARNAFANIPTRTTTLRRIANTKYYGPAITAIRAETEKALQDEMKKKLPAITAAAFLHHRKKDTSFAEKISQQWPLMMGDIDKKDNPHVDMAVLKTHIARLPYVLMCAYSVRGGLWFVLRLPDQQTPETLAGHFRYLQKVFTKLFKVNLDPSKGGNPTDLRFVSYDPKPFINDNATVLKGTYTPPTPRLPPPPFIINNRQQFGEWELKQVVELARKAQKGDRHYPLLKAATLAGGFIGAGRLDHDTAVYALETIASELDDFRDSVRVIKDGIHYGEQKPLFAEDNTPYRQVTARPLPVASVSDTRSRWNLNGQNFSGEVLEVPPCEDYPPEWDAPNPPGEVPTIKAISVNQYLSKPIEQTV